jgi:hypothetical protein
MNSSKMSENNNENDVALINNAVKHLGITFENKQQFRGGGRAVVAEMKFDEYISFLEKIDPGFWLYFQYTGVVCVKEYDFLLMRLKDGGTLDIKHESSISIQQIFRFIEITKSFLISEETPDIMIQFELRNVYHDWEVVSRLSELTLRIWEYQETIDKLKKHPGCPKYEENFMNHPLEIEFDVKNVLEFLKLRT